MLKDQGVGVRGLSVAETAPAINHLLFADDSLLFSEANDENAVRVRDLLRTYCDASGQKINTDKSSIFFSKGIPKTTRNEI